MGEDLSGGDLSRLRQLNALAVIKALRGGPSLTLTEVAKRTGLSRASAEDVVRELLQMAPRLPGSGLTSLNCTPSALPSSP
ncbi:helix-turn-helix domain-containing protein, partial [Nonomuraea sp. NPDC003201]